MEHLLLFNRRRRKLQRRVKTILRINALVIGIALFFCSSLIPTGHAQQAQTETQAVQVIGLAGLKENTKGRLTDRQRNSAVYSCQGQRRRGRRVYRGCCHGKG